MKRAHHLTSLSYTTYCHGVAVFLNLTQRLYLYHRGQPVIKVVPVRMLLSSSGNGGQTECDTALWWLLVSYGHSSSAWAKE